MTVAWIQRELFMQMLFVVIPQYQFLTTLVKSDRAKSLQFVTARVNGWFSFYIRSQQAV